MAQLELASDRQGPRTRTKPRPRHTDKQTQPIHSQKHSLKHAHITHVSARAQTHTTHRHMCRHRHKTQTPRDFTQPLSHMHAHKHKHVCTHPRILTFIQRAYAHIHASSHLHKGDDALPKSPCRVQHAHTCACNMHALMSAHICTRFMAELPIDTERPQQ